MGGGGFEVQDFLLGFAQVVAGFGKYPLQEMPVLFEGIVMQEFCLILTFDPSDAQAEELAVVLDLPAELLDFVEPCLEFRIVLVLVGAEQEIIAFIAIRAVPSL